MNEIRATLNERGGRYGRFDAHAGLAEHLIRVAQFSHNGTAEYSGERRGWTRLAPDQKHAIRYILDKIARILEGDPDYADNWHDIAGYATLIEDRLNGTGLYAPTTPIVQASQCGAVPRTAGQIVIAKCRECHANLGDAHAPDCILNQDPSHSR